MTLIPALQSWCIIPSKDPQTKFTKAHQYLQRNPSVANELKKREQLNRLSAFRVKIKGVVNDENENEADKGSNTTFDVLSNEHQVIKISAIDIINSITFWNLTDILDIQELPDGDFEVKFKTAISAHVMTRIPIFQANVLDQVPKTARVPLVFIQGIGPEKSEDEIRSFFRHIAPILKIKFIQRGKMAFHILKLSSIHNVLEIIHQNHSTFGPNQKNKMIITHQYKSTVTRCFFISSILKISLSQEDVSEQVSNFGDIECIFTRKIGDYPEFYVKMRNIKDARLACGAMNGRTFENVEITAVFITTQYFDELFNSL
ncbi:hypothetical protein TRFO_00935 [Tritrichomonas foetus]|uniref:RRM domain-containing protein n=1 Tax=Tritrichomonas foetus TaxID=1144522 RepID=A0A1J4L6S6_9EUKA|nr:hypothetical protein TRFO_00935 [Tritrichomonas foetus]|eukprot:OHT17653.1 hypothetical protein TRFO_00935 [Tritrichomonas foetus]